MEQVNHSIAKPRVLILDVYETLLDMSDVERKVNMVFNSSKGYTIWFELFMQSCFVDNCIRQFHEFATLAKASMEMTAQKLGRTIESDTIDDVMEMLKHLPVHENVQEGLSLLNDMGYRIAALTNSPKYTIDERMEPTGLISYFEAVLSAEQAKQYKPMLEIYEWAAKKLRVAPEEALLVSSHGWDIAGGAAAGMKTAFIQRGKQALYPLAPKPNFVCKDLMELAHQLANLVGTDEVKAV
ncbi:MAG TPA: haloacid dehalogenase type II [Flavisolibacter sp.]|nr:haloacid dehalogenase type II [Flavisolibacter sp.]